MVCLLEMRGRARGRRPVLVTHAHTSADDSMLASRKCMACAATRLLRRLKGGYMVMADIRELSCWAPASANSGSL